MHDENLKFTDTIFHLSIQKKYQ